MGEYGYKRGLGGAYVPLPRLVREGSGSGPALDPADNATIYDEARHWLMFGKPGSWYMYHVGNLAADRERDLKLDSVASLLYRAYEDGRVELVQLRNDWNSHKSYLAQKRR